jgi:hypothetical protein
MARMHDAPSPVDITVGVDGIDWVGLKAALATDHWDNGRTPEEYETSSRRSRAIVVRDGDMIVGTWLSGEAAPPER